MGTGGTRPAPGGPWASSAQQTAVDMPAGRRKRAKSPAADKPPPRKPYRFPPRENGAVGLPNRSGSDCFWLSTLQCMRHAPGYVDNLRQCTVGAPESVVETVRAATRAARQTCPLLPSCC